MKGFLLFLFICGVINANPLDPFIRDQINVHTYYSAMIDHYQNEHWQQLSWKCEDLITDFPNSPFAREAFYYLGLAQFKLKEYEYANKAFSSYLKEEITPKFFEETIRFKFKIATKFDSGARTHVFGWRRMPKWVSAYEEAIEIYEEVITTMPRDDLAAQSLYRKGVALLKIKEYKKSIETFQTLYRRFPKHLLAVDAYIGIADVYLAECQQKFRDPSKLELAQINLQKFKEHFPKEPRIEEVDKKLFQMEEQLASDLLEVAQFYERTKKKHAAMIYYGNIIKKYPKTHAARKGEEMLKAFQLSTYCPN